MQNFKAVIKAQAAIQRHAAALQLELAPDAQQYHAPGESRVPALQTNHPSAGTRLHGNKAARLTKPAKADSGKYRKLCDGRSMPNAGRASPSAKGRNGPNRIAKPRSTPFKYRNRASRDSPATGAVPRP